MKRWTILLLILVFLVTAAGCAQKAPDTATPVTFYYPADEYISYLMTVEELEFYDEIECDDLFVGSDIRERILIFRLPGYESGE